MANVEVEGEEPPQVEEALAEPTHDPFRLAVFSIAKTQQNQNGLRHSDHLRYRQYCARRMRRLHNTLKFKHSRKGRSWIQTPYPADFQDSRFLEIPLVNAERAWAYAVQLKADNATASEFNARWRLHSIRRFAKAAKWAEFLESQCKRHADQKTQLEAEAYVALMHGTLQLEREEWEEALGKFNQCRKVLKHLQLASEQAESTIFKQQFEELAPMIRECRYNLGMTYDEEDEDADHKPSVADQAPPRKDLSGLNYRNRGLAIPSDKIKTKLLKVLKMVNATQVGQDESSVVIDKYGELSTEFGEVLKDIHSDMINAGAEGQTAEWRMLEAFARELSICMNVERNMVLLWNHLAKLDGIEEIGTSESRKTFRPEEGMRYCDLLKEDVDNLRGLPETTGDMSTAFAAYLTLIMNCRCFFLGLCYTSVGKALEAASLLDMLHNRVDDVTLGKALVEPLGRLFLLFTRVQQKLPGVVSRWRCRGLAKLAIVAATDGGSKAQGGLVSGGLAPEKALQELVQFPPKVRDIACKPLLFDLAFPCIEEPDLDSVLPKQETKKKGVLGNVAGKLGGVFSGWGRK